jgi:hypothetical protein
MLPGLALRAATLVVPSSAPAGGVPAALKGEKYPWYDAGIGRVKPVLPYEFRFSWLDRLGKWLAGWYDTVAGWFGWLNHWRVPGIAGAGDLVMIGLLMLLLTVVLVALLELLRRYRPLVSDDATGAVVVRSGGSARVEGLPLGGLDFSDPWNEAQRLRIAGDYAGAVVYLFAHQLLTLDRAGRIRLVPGRTGRQLVRAVADRQLRSLVEPTLRLFESVYYGRLAPSIEAFEQVWARAVEFQTLLPEEASR